MEMDILNEQVIGNSTGIRHFGSKKSLYPLRKPLLIQLNFPSPQANEGISLNAEGGMGVLCPG
jgi:hypothetical protein